MRNLLPHKDTFAQCHTNSEYPCSIFAFDPLKKIIHYTTNQFQIQETLKLYYLRLFEPHHKVSQKSLRNVFKKSNATLLISSDKWSMIWSEWWLSSYQSTRHDAWRGYDETAKKLRLMALKATPNTDKQMIAIFLEQQQLLVGSITETF